MNTSNSRANHSKKNTESLIGENLQNEQISDLFANNFKQQKKKQVAFNKKNKLGADNDDELFIKKNDSPDRNYDDIKCKLSSSWRIN